ncbi:MAG: TonB-dependent receptor [Acidobacteria bacterium]|nr:TonB-dependent receptor [Acidobacteriota bacterium]
MDLETVSTHQKAARLNHDRTAYGAFAEIGAAQEVVAWFFRSGRASGTVAKSMSAYDMVVSDAIYGPSTRYVSRQRLQSMLTHEYSLLQERLDAARGDSTKFFAFADTVATNRRSQPGNGHGWLGIRFQHEPRAEASEILIHVRLLDPVTLREQEVIGVLGVNLIYGAFYLNQQPQELISTLMDGLSRVRLEVDMIKFAGPAFAGVDNRLMSLQLVAQGLTDAAVFTATGEAVEPAEILFGRPVLLQRGSFRPVTNITLDMLYLGGERLIAERKIDEKRMVVLMEMSLKNLMPSDQVDHEDFMARVDMLGALGHPVMISNFSASHRLTGYLRRYTKLPIGHVMGLGTLRSIFQEEYYADLPGGILEALGLLLQGDTALYVYPMWDQAASAPMAAEQLDVAPNLRSLYQYLLENKRIFSLPVFDAADLPVMPAEILQRIQSGDTTWQNFVPPPVAERIRTDKLFGYHA